MDARTLTALKRSIAKWQAIVDDGGIDLGPENCPLCAAFWQYYECKGCPVKTATNSKYCRGSPYTQWVHAWERATGTSAEDGAFVVDAATHRAAKAELAFLQSLLPEEQA